MKRIRQIFINRVGNIRAIWLLVIAMSIYALAIMGVYYGYWNAYQTLMHIWGVTSENIVRAPMGVRFLYQWSNVFVQLLQNALLLGGAYILCRLTRYEKQKILHWSALGKGVGIGALCIVGMWCVLLLTGSVRLGWRITRPMFSINTGALLLTTLSAAISEGVFFYYGLYGGMKKLLPKWAALCIVMGVHVALAMLSGVFLPVRLINSILMVGVCALLADRINVLATIGFRFAWSWLEQAIFGFVGATAALYETYPVNLYWLNGGNEGLMNALLVTLVLVGLCAWLMKEHIQAHLLHQANEK